MSIDLVLLQRFEAVHRLGSFSAAADSLAITHSAITKSIQALEERWNVRLFDRTTRRITPTAAGQRLALAAPALLAHADSVRADVMAGDRQLRVICGPAVIDTFIPAALLQFREQHPEVAVLIETMPPDLACDRLLRREAQLLIFHSTSIAGLPKRKDLAVVRLITQGYRVVFRPGHPIAASDGSLDTMLAFDWAVAGYDTSFQAGLPLDLREQLRSRGFPRYRVLNQAACIGLAERSDVLTLLPATAAAPLVAQGRLADMAFPGGAGFAISAVTHGTAAPAGIVAAFIAAIRSAVAG